MTPELVRQLELDYLRWPLWCVVGADDLEMKAVEWAARKTREPQFQAGQPRPALINIDGGRVTVYPEAWPRKVVAALWREALLECGHWHSISHTRR